MDDKAGAFRVGFATGVMPDKWARAWAERMPRRPLDLVPLQGRDGVAMVRAGELHMCLVRLPVDREGLHLIPLYDEQPVVVVAQGAPGRGLRARSTSPTWPTSTCSRTPTTSRSGATWPWRCATGSRYPVPEMSLRQAVESVAADAGIVIVPMSVARLHHRKDVVAVPVSGVPTTKVGLTWPVDAADTGDDRYEAFIGVVRGRRATQQRDRRRPPQLYAGL